MISDEHRARHLLGSLEVAQRLGIWEWTPATDEMVWSDGLYEILDVSPRIAPSIDSLIATVHPADRRHFETHLSRARRERGLLAFRCRSGGERTMQISMQRTLAEDGSLRSIVGTNQDITGEAHPTDAATMLATLTGTIAHEINNPLAVISAVLQMSPPSSATQDALLAVDRISSLLVDLNLYAWGDHGSKGMVHLEHLVGVALAQVPDLGGATVTTRLDHTVPVRANATALGRVLIELIGNAVDAVETTPKKDIEIVTRSDGREWSLIEIADSGTGIAPPVQGRVFDPFFTTKGIGRRGLGLSICRGIVDSLGGSITIHPSGGTRVVVALPTSQPQPQVKGTASEQAKAGGDRGRVLVVDDEVLFANALSRLLSSEHDVTIVHDGLAALRLIEGGARFDSILCDVVMPVMTGIELRERLQQIAPDQVERMIFVTGGALDPTALEILKLVENFEKPCDVAELREAVRRRVAASKRVS